MVADTLQVRAELEKRAADLAKGEGLKPCTKAYSDFIKKYGDLRNIPSSVIEDRAMKIKAGAKHGDEALEFAGKNIDEGIDVVKGTSKILNSFDDVADYIKKNGKLPDNFITKEQAKALGWDPKKGNLAEVTSGKSIGGDIFKNKGNLLPDATGRVWYEADINYTGGFRGTDRIIYSNDELIYKTSDHYKTFTQIR